MDQVHFKITEHDEAGKVTGTFVGTKADSHEQRRVDLIPPEAPKALWQRSLDVFLPAGYPHSVTSDYLEYQIYDSLQAFASSIAGLLASRATLSSVGVGDATASPTAAMLLSIWQESAGRIATILFAYRLGSALEPECKMYRLLADIFNDIGFILDCLSPVFPKSIRVLILSFSSILRALCGVAAGSAKASLSAHFARWDNLGELNAKDSSQETVISLIGNLVGGLVVSWVETSIATWTVLIILLAVHLETNRRAVRAISMRSLNRQRATLVYHQLLKDRVLTPEEVSAREYIFEKDGVLRAPDEAVLGYCIIGASFSALLRSLSTEITAAGSFRTQHSIIEILSIYNDRGYLLWASSDGRGSQPCRIRVVLKQGAATRELICAWWQSIALARRLSKIEDSDRLDSERILHLVRQTMESAEQMLKDYEERLKAVGWDLSTNALETISGSRVSAAIG